MMNYMREGGYGMWMILVTSIAVAAWGLTRPKSERSSVFLAGCIVALIQGILGLSTGMEAVARHMAERGSHYPDQGAVVAIGLGELANNGTFAVFFAAAFGLAAILTRAKPATA